MATISVSFGDSGTNYTELQDFLDDYNSGTIVTESSTSHTIASTDDIVCSIETNIDFTPVTASSGTYFNPPTKPNTLTIKGANGFTGGLLSSAETVTMQGPGWLRLGVISGMSGFGYIFEDLRWNCNGYRSNNSNYSMFHAFGSSRGGQLNRVVVDNYTITHASHAGWVFHSDCRSSKYLDLNSVGITNFDGGTGSGARYGFLVSGSSANNKLEASHCFTYNCNWGSGSGTQHAFHRSNSSATNMNLKGCVSLGNTFGSGTTGAYGTIDTLQDCGSDDSTASSGLQSLTTAQLDNWANPINDLNLDSTSTIKSSARQLAAQNATGTTLTLDLNGDDRSTVDAQNTADKWSLGAVQFSSSPAATETVSVISVSASAIAITSTASLTVSCPVVSSTATVPTVGANAVITLDCSVASAVASAVAPTGSQSSTAAVSVLIVAVTAIPPTVTLVNCCSAESTETSSLSGTLTAAAGSSNPVGTASATATAVSPLASAAYLDSIGVVSVSATAINLASYQSSIVSLPVASVLASAATLGQGYVAGQRTIASHILYRNDSKTTFTITSQELSS